MDIERYFKLWDFLGDLISSGDFSDDRYLSRSLVDLSSYLHLRIKECIYEKKDSQKETK